MSARIDRITLAVEAMNDDLTSLIDALNSAIEREETTRNIYHEWRAEAIEEGNESDVEFWDARIDETWSKEWGLREGLRLVREHLC